jgi:TonB family protein
MSPLPALVIILAANFLLAASPHDLERDLRKTYAERLLSLRTPISYDVIHFNLEGHPTRATTGEPWTTCGLFKVKKISVKSGQVAMDGERVIVVLNPAAEEKKLLLVTVERSVHVIIDLPMTIETPADMGRLLARIFLPGDLQKRMAAEWVPSVDLRGDLDEIGKSVPGGRVGTLAGDRPVYTVGADSLVRPLAVYKPGPRYPEKALFKRVSGTIRVRVIINEKGFPEILEILQHLREGLDNRALAAVSEWRFKPATKDGIPVAAMMVVEVKFHLR